MRTSMAPRRTNSLLNWCETRTKYHASVLNFKAASARVRLMRGRGGVRAGLAVALYLIANEATIAPAESAITSQNK
jgi:hypothetical protein